mmetsp:Transcript_87099/g.230621  ORF Transcript_87099/g.230621 Transcript_87099/m.230621 type:complete len:143 (+) Transcript_87099:3-431(+)
MQCWLKLGALLSQRTVLSSTPFSRRLVTNGHSTTYYYFGRHGRMQCHEQRSLFFVAFLGALPAVLLVAWSCCAREGVALEPGGLGEPALFWYFRASLYEDASVILSIMVGCAACHALDPSPRPRSGQSGGGLGRLRVPLLAL